MHFHTHKHTHIYIHIHIHIHTDICRNRSSFRESAPKSRRSSSRWAGSCLVAIFCQKRRSKETHIVSKPFWHITCCIILKIPLCCIPVRVLAPHAVKTNASKRPMLRQKEPYCVRQKRRILYQNNPILYSSSCIGVICCPKRRMKKTCMVSKEIFYGNCLLVDWFALFCHRRRLKRISSV